ncbi:SGNH/GDSL hydrolase family protein [Bacillus sp. 03113]|uniref:SGNH/GDSL hydrolase family protein n=1 Tax=Bacillus sp. 03113 TaxID=2578211 RepID=UPI001142F423|nr:SGNH/GDSL hydrolase family protein [Bacillus sp. 03113]
MKAISVKIITIFSVVFTILWVCGLFWTMKDQFTQGNTKEVVTVKSTNDEEDNQEAYQILALGDSLTRGTGDESGKGYVGVLVDELKAKTKQTIHVTNTAIKGQTSTQLVEQMKQPEIQRQVKQANVILLTIGGNDLFRGGEAIVNLSESETKKSESTYLQNINEVFTTIRQLNPDATVFHIGLYNPFIELDNPEQTSQIVRSWNNDSAEVAASFKKIVYVPTFDLFQLNVNDYLYNDHFHPNQEGYKLIAERAASLLTFQKEGQTNDNK